MEYRLLFMMKNDNDLISRGIREKVDFSPYAGLTWVVALSGGADSRMLLELAASGRKLASGLKAVYVHHHLQEIADEWAVFCERECRDLGVDFCVEHVHVKPEGSVEANAREARYAALAKYIDAGCVLFTAHHADDLLETVLMALNRGCGLPGMSAIPPVQPFARGFLARPMLSVSRKEVEEFCRINNLQYVTDPTNACVKYDRNYLRHEVVPVIKRRFPGILEGVRKVSENLYDDMLLYEDMLKDRLSGYVDDLPYAGKSLNLKKLALMDGTLADNYRKALIRLFLRHFYGVSLSRKQLHELMKFMDNDDAKARLNVEDMVIGLYRGHLTVTPDTGCLIRAGELRLNPGDRVKCGKFTFVLKKSETAGDKKEDCNTADISGDGTVLLSSGEFRLPENTCELTLCFTPVSSMRLKPETRNHSQILKQLWKEYGVPLCMRPLHPAVGDGKGTVFGIHGVFRTDYADKGVNGGDGITVMLMIYLEK